MNPQERIVQWQELAEHSIKTNLWVMINGKIYDVTTYLAEHPGGDDILIRHGGKDATEQFTKANHSDYAISLRDARLVGQIESGPKPEWYEKNISEIKAKNRSLNSNRDLAWSEVESHCTKSDLWVVIDGKVYDLTEFKEEHPGGPAVLSAQGGRDATAQFNAINHTLKAKAQMEQYKVGIVHGNK